MNKMTDIGKVTHQLFREIPKDKIEEAWKVFTKVYGSYPSCANLQGQHYFDKMHEKLSDAYNQAKNSVK